MGSITISNEGVEKRLDSVEEKVSENTGVLTSGFKSMLINMRDSLRELRFLNLITEKTYKTGEGRNDIKEDL